MNFTEIKESLKLKSGKVSDYYKSGNPAFFLVMGFVFVISILTFSTSLNNNFIVNWDDTKFITENYWIRNLSFQTLYDIFFTLIAENYHPLTHLSNAIEFSFFGLNPWPYHLINLIIHLLNAFLVFKLFLSLNKDVIKSGFAALLFSIHPMHVESLAWLSERKDLLYSFFFLISLIYYVQYIEGKKITDYYYALIFFVLSLLSKSMAVVLAPLLIVFDLYFRRVFDKKIIIEKLPFFLLALFFGILTLYSQGKYGALNSAPSFPFLERILLVSYSVLFYIFKFFIPIQLSAYHPYPEMQHGLLPLIYYLAPFILLGLGFIIFLAKKMRRELLFGLALYLIPISLVLQMVPSGNTIVSERFSYISYLGLIFIVVEIPNFIPSKISKYFWYFLLMLVIGFSFMSFKRTAVWKDGFVLFKDVSEKYPQSYYAYWSMGTAKYLSGENEDALVYYKKCIELNPDFEDTYLKMGLIKYKEKDFNSAIELNKLAILHNKKDPVAYNNLGIVEMSSGDSISAVNHFIEALEIENDYLLALTNLADLSFKLKMYDKSINAYNRILKLHPADPDLLARLAMSKFSNGDFKGALLDFDASIRINPMYAEIFTMRGEVFDKMNETEKAILDYSQALYLNNRYGPAYFQRANAKFKMGKNRAACDDWKKAAFLRVSGANEMIEMHCR